MPQRVPGKVEAFQSYNDAWRGWPVVALKSQHPVRGSFLDPRPDPRRGAVYHTGVDVGVRDDRPEQGAPPGRTHRVFAIEGGRVHEATPRGICGFARIGHFGYGHVDSLVEPGQVVRPGQHIGWTCRGYWHVHLSEFIFTGGEAGSSSTPSGEAGSSVPTSTAPRRGSTSFASTHRRRRAGAAAWGRRSRSCRRPAGG